MILTFHNVRDIINGLKNDTVVVSDNLQALNEEIKQDLHYEVTEDFYIFYQKRPNAKGDDETIKYPIEIRIVDQIFKDYSKHGNNLSGEEILQKYQIKAELFNLLKSRLRLFKSSHVVSPATLDRCSDAELEHILSGAIDEHIKDRYRSRFTKTFEKMKQEDYVKKSKILANHQYFLESLQGYLTNYQPREITILNEQPQNSDEITVMFTDIHIGKMNTENVLNRIHRMTIDLINRPESIINLVCLGDLFETLTKGGMHNGQIETMDGPFGFDLLMKGVHVFEDMLASLYKSGKKITFYGLG